MFTIPSEPSARRPAFGLACGILAGLLVTLPAQAAFNPLSGPILSAPAVAPNVVMLFDNSSSMALNSVGNETRLTVARDVAKELIGNNRNVRFGLFGFRDTVTTGGVRDAPGGDLLVDLGDISAGTVAGDTRFNALINSLDRISPSVSAPYTYTPLAETYYEMTRYLRGLPAFYPQSLAAANRQQFVSPVQYRCQRNYGLVITDGLPTYDSEFPAAASEDPDIDNPDVAGALNLPDWDGDANGDVNSNDPGAEGSTFYLDDIAGFAFDTDMRNANRNGVSTDLAGLDWDDPAFPIQNMRTYTVGFALNDSNLERAATLGGGWYYTAASRQELSSALGRALGEINSTPGSAGGGVASGPELTSGSQFYRAQYDPADWSGTIDAYAINSAGGLGSLSWSSDSTVTANSNALYQIWRQPSGARPGAVVTLDTNAYSRLGSGQRAALDHAAAPNRGQDLLDWSLGRPVAGYRSRGRLLGDVVNSSLVLARAGQALGRREHSGYDSYLTDKRRNMVSSLLVGSNDGFMHVLAASDGAHRLAFMPASVQPALGARARVDFVRNGHHSGVDGAIVVGDVELKSTWTTLALGGFGAGGKGLVGLRLYDQSAGNGALGGLWEISPATTGYADLGHVYGKAVIARLDGRWVAITGNGYGGAAGQPILYVIDLADGSLLKSIAAGSADPASGNGLSAPRVTTDSNGRALAAYAGDLQGRLWKFDLTGPPGDWQVAFAGDPLFRAAIASNPSQPITVQPTLLDHPQGGRLVLFGTGKFLEAADRLDTSVQAFYAVWDKPGGAGNLSYSHLQPQRILTESTSGGRSVRTISSHRVNWNSTSGQGWYLPLLHGPATGERVIRNIVTRGGRVLFNTALIKPGTDPCVSTGGGWLMSIDSFSGGMLPVATLDSDGDGLVDTGDPLSAGVNLSGGLPGDLVVLELPRIRPLDAARPLAPGSCDPALEFCPCDPTVDDCVCDPADTACKNIYCGQEYNFSQTTNTLELVAGSGQCRFRRVMWRQLM
ncbi:PilC/PilY family type IV pilus protein [Halopseudomonas sp.]|uniref:PilC/PilY family type IV pilus protein n=1 Tax=Halopseudomonas sp. TaxID=2901191 RepID=UPI0035614BF2